MFRYSAVSLYLFSMRFAQKLTLLIIGCIIVLGGLCLIQYYLIRNTYRLEQSAYLQQVKQRLGTRGQVLIDSLNHQGMVALLRDIRDSLESGRKPSLNNFQQQIEVVAAPHRHAISQALSGDSLLHDNHYVLLYTHVVLYHRQVADTLLPGGAPPLVLTGGNADQSANVLPISEGLQQAGFSLGTDTVTAMTYTPAYRLSVWTKAAIVAEHWQATILRRMAWTLIGSALLIIAVTVIFFLVFMTLFRQKQIADVTTDFANNMTHELKTPLSSAAVVVKSLRTPEARLDESWYGELLNELDRQHEKIRRMMDSILTSAMDQPMGMTQSRPFNLAGVLKEMEQLVTASGRDLQYTGNEDIVVNADPDLLTGILANLVDNALKYTPAGTSLHIHTEIAGRTLRISLEDQGSGIPSSLRRHLFRKFFRVPRPAGNHIRGLGLGLYLCRMQAKQLGGDIAYHTSASGGSLFTITLPYDNNTAIIGRG
ncbi:HAMP domain-containing histidine kinase [Pseudoflavitalea sp. X16]|uniref:sensor histidine kinase n=1 Tax=Paraflavitalea devenefica TaxID=2716334 RepID=UPI00142288F0|nr:HAMP domain-containing sensor histidine kinase [Paraflavitalea devenefica]NII26433.1 HAMP domain-containing histidine kinase [Paraflavitalea devenefica]